jgi:hypothetical protein
VLALSECSPGTATPIKVPGLADRGDILSSLEFTGIYTSQLMRMMRPTSFSS